MTTFLRVQLDQRAAQPAIPADAAARPKIVGILEFDFVLMAVPAYSGGAAEWQSVGP